MARIVRSVGACPVCGESVRRTVSLFTGPAHETFHCPTHGRLQYSQRSVPLASLAAAAAALGDLASPSRPGRPTSSVQQATGLEVPATAS